MLYSFPIMASLDLGFAREEWPARRHSVQEVVVRRANIITGMAGMLGAGAGAFAMLPSDMPDTSFGLPAWLMPVVALGLIGLMSLLLMVRALMAKGPDETPSAEYRDAAALLPGLVLSAMGAAAVAWLGFLMGGPLLIAALMLLIGERRPLRIVLVSVLPPALLALFATHVLGVPLP